MIFQCVILTWILLVAVECQVNPESQLPDDYIVEVDQVCGQEGDQSSLSVTSDLTINVKVQCKGDNLFTFTTEDDVVHTHTVYFSGNETEKCIYVKENRVALYKVTVIVNVVEEDEGVSSINREARYTMTCTYGDQGEKRSRNSSVEEQYYSAREVQSIYGNLTTEEVSVFITDILGRPIKNDNVPMDKFLCLKVRLNNSTGLGESRKNMSIFPVSCEAIGTNTGHHYALIRSGCGDGVVFKKTQGFTMMPGMAISGYFKFFHLNKDKSFRISCNFTLCTNCINQNSCSGARTKDIFDIFGDWINSGNRLGLAPVEASARSSRRARRYIELGLDGARLAAEKDFRFAESECRDCYPEPVTE